MYRACNVPRLHRYSEASAVSSLAALGHDLARRRGRSLRATLSSGWDVGLRLPADNGLLPPLTPADPYVLRRLVAAPSQSGSPAAPGCSPGYFR